MESLKEFQPIITESDRELCDQIFILLNSSDFESRNLGRVLFKTTDFYKRNKPSNMWIGNILGHSEHKVNIKFLASEGYTFEDGNYYFAVFKMLIINIKNNVMIHKFYRYGSK